MRLKSSETSYRLGPPVVVGEVLDVLALNCTQRSISTSSISSISSKIPLATASLVSGHIPPPGGASFRRASRSLPWPSSSSKALSFALGLVCRRLKAKQLSQLVRGGTV